MVLKGLTKKISRIFKGKVVLHNAVKAGDQQQVKDLLDNGANINAMDSEGATPLFVALDKGHTEIANFLMEEDADVNASQDDEGFTPLFLAVTQAFIEQTGMLIKKGADINAINKKGYTPLHIATGMNNSELTRLLIENGANINLRNNN